MSPGIRNDARHDEVGRLYKEGNSIRQVSASMGISYARVWAILKRDGVERRTLGEGRRLSAKRDRAAFAVQERARELLKVHAESLEQAQAAGRARAAGRHEAVIEALQEILGNKEP